MAYSIPASLKEKTLHMHCSPSQMSTLLSASPPLTTEAQLETGLRDHSQQHSNPGHSLMDSTNGGRSEGARAGCSMEGGLRVQGPVVQWREV